MAHRSTAFVSSVLLIAACCGSCFRECLAEDSPVTAGRKETVEALGRVLDRSSGQHQHGEPVLAIGESAADAPRCRQKDDPWIELLSLKKGAQDSFILRLKFVEGRPERFVVVIKTAGGRYLAQVTDRMVTVTPPAFTGLFHSTGLRDPDHDGVYELGLPNFGDRAEAWAEYDPNSDWLKPVTPQRLRSGIKISNSVVTDGVGQRTFSRLWTDEEKQFARNEQLKNAPPPPPPTGYTVIQESTSGLLPGMPILAAELGEWKPAELLGVNPKKLALRVTAPQSFPGAKVVDRSRCAVSREVLDRGKNDPASFKPSYTVFPTTGMSLPPDFQLLKEGDPVHPGMLLRSAQNQDVTYMGPAGDGRLKVRSQSNAEERINLLPSELAVRTSDLAKASESGAEATFRARRDALLALLDRQAQLREEEHEIHRRLQKYSATAATVRTDVPPDGFVALGEEQPISTGIPVLVRVEGQWYAGLVDEPSSAGRVDVHVEGRSYKPDVRAARANVFFKPAPGTTAPEVSASDGPRDYEFTIESGGESYRLREALKRELEIPATNGGPTERIYVKATVSRTPVKARLLEYQLSAAGAKVTVNEAPAKP